MADRGTLVMDVDGTLCPTKKPGQDYQALVPHHAMVRRLSEWRRRGHRIVLFTARNMRTYDGDLAKIHRHTAPILVAWLERWKIPYDELVFGKPWPGENGLYVDDRAVRPDEFLDLTRAELQALIDRSRRRLETLADIDA